MRPAPNKASESWVPVSMTPGQRSTSTASMVLPGTVRAHLVDGRGHSRQRRGIDAQLALRGLHAAQVHGAVDLAALEVLAQQLP